MFFNWVFGGVKMFQTIKSLFLTGEILRLSTTKPETINPDGVPRNKLVHGARPVIQTVMNRTEFHDGEIYKIYRREQVREDLAVEECFSYVIVPKTATKLFDLIELCDFEIGMSLKKDGDEINVYFDSRWERVIELYESFEPELRECFRIEIARLLKSWPGELKGAYLQDLEPDYLPKTLESRIQAIRFARGGDWVKRVGYEDMGLSYIARLYLKQGGVFLHNSVQYMVVQMFVGATLFVYKTPQGDEKFVVARDEYDTLAAVRRLSKKT